MPQDAIDYFEQANNWLVACATQLKTEKKLSGKLDVALKDMKLHAAVFAK